MRNFTLLCLDGKCIKFQCLKIISGSLSFYGPPEKCYQIVEGFFGYSCPELLNSGSFFSLSFFKLGKKSLCYGCSLPEHQSNHEQVD